jgi:hypothetical protein
MQPITPTDRDYMIRTVIGEAADQPDEGQAAVAHVILNRVNEGFGDNPKDVVLAPNQFEPWQTRAAQLKAINTKSPDYQHAATIVDSVLSGDAPDPTQGATHFLQPNIVRQRYGKLPDWAQGNGLQIGQHVFYKPGTNYMPQQTQDATVTQDDIQETLRQAGVAPGAAPIAQSAATNDGDIAETLRQAGVTMPPANQSQITTPDVSVGPDGRLRIVIHPKPKYDIGLGYQNQLSEGMPVIGPLLDKAVAATGAAIQPLLEQTQGKNFAERYANNLADIVSEKKQFSEQHPIGSTVANLAGGGMALGPLASTRLGGTMLGTYGPSLASRIYTGAAGGAGLNSLDAVLRGDNPISAAEIGAGGGAAGPIIGKGVNTVASGVIGALKPQTGPLGDLLSGTVSKLAGALEGETPQTLAAAKTRMGPAGMLADVNPAMTDIAGGVADIPGPQKAVVRGAFQQRAAQQGQRIDQALKDSGLPKVNIEDFKSYTTEAKKAAADPLYEQWRSMQVQPTPALKELMPTLDKLGLLNSAEEHSLMRGVPFDKNFFTTGPQKNYPTTESWDMVKRAIDSRIDGAYSAGEKTKAADLITLKNRMVGEIEKTPAGQVWKQARTEFADHAAIEEQIQAGQDTFLGGRSGLTADQMRTELKGLSGPELAARKIGLGSAVREAMGQSIRGDTTLRNKLLAPNNQEKMRLLLGDQKTNQLIQTLEQESYLADQYKNVVGGSPTAPKQQRIKALQNEPLPSWGLRIMEPGTWVPPAFRPSHVMEAWRGLGNEKTINQLGSLMATPAGPSMDQLISSIHQEALRRTAQGAAAARGSNALAGLISGPATTTARRQIQVSQ